MLDNKLKSDIEIEKRESELIVSQEKSSSLRVLSVTFQDL